MRKLIILLFVLSGVAAQAQRGWSPEAFSEFQENARIVGKPIDNVSIEKYMNDAMKNCFVYPNPAIADKAGNIPAKKINVYKVKGKVKGGFYFAWDYIVTLEPLWGNVKTEIKHPLFSDITLVSSLWQVPQDLVPGYIFCRPTLAQFKKLSTEDKNFASNGGIFFRKITKAELKKYGY
jgi:hypothetical protein